MNQDIGKHWNACYDTGKDFQCISSTTISTFLSHTDSALPKTCLDIGCGTGQLTRELMHRGYNCLGIDASSSAIKLAQSLTVASKQKLTYQTFDIERDNIIQLPQHHFSLITCKLVYAFIKDKAAFREKINQLLVPGGIFVMMTPLSEDAPDKPATTVSPSQLDKLAKTFLQTHIVQLTGQICFIGKK